MNKIINNFNFPSTPIYDDSTEDVIFIVALQNQEGIFSLLGLICFVSSYFWRSDNEEKITGNKVKKRKG